MVNFEKSMVLPVKIDELSKENNSIYITDSKGLYVTLVLAEDDDLQDEQNILDTRKDAVFIVNAVNNIENMYELLQNYENLLIENQPDSEDLIRINNIKNSFKNIDYENGIPYHWNDNDI